MDFTVTRLPVWRSRRGWLATQAFALASPVLRSILPRPRLGGWSGRRSSPSSRGLADRLARTATPLDPAPWQALAMQAVDTARTGGARYADARLTRVLVHEMEVAGGRVARADERVGIGVRALVDGYWGFSASAIVAPDEAARLARDAVAQAKTNAKGPPWTVDLGESPIARGTWATPIRIDPFAIPIEEKQDFLLYWKARAARAGVAFPNNGADSWVQFVREERVVATSEGALFTQTVYESGGQLICSLNGGSSALGNGGSNSPTQDVHGMTMAGAGWERFLDARILEQFASGQIQQELRQKAAVPSRPAAIGKYTLVCDGATMAALVEETLGVATQLDRALGYEADARGTTVVDDPLAMVGQLAIAAPVVTLTANRSAPGELATVKWDDEGVVPEPFTLIQDGVLVDFQTTREQAAWLAPYYHRQGRPVRSHGCAASEDAHVTPIQHLPNLSLEPSASPVRLEDLIADVTTGILVEGGDVLESDSQARSGLLIGGRMRQIRNGQVGAALSGGAVLFDAPSLWKHVQAVGGPSTQDVRWSSCHYFSKEDFVKVLKNQFGKGQPSQRTSHSVRAAAATLPNQPLINPSRKA